MLRLVASLLCIGGAGALSVASKSPVVNALKKVRGLSVSVEYLPKSDGQLGSSELGLLSMQLRKSKVTAIWTPCIEAVNAFAEEQKGAKGDFPGPCPVIFNGNSAQAEAAVAAGASAVVLDTAQADTAPALDALLMWRVGGADDVQRLVESNSSPAAFVIQGDSAAVTAALSAVPGEAVAVASLEAMQPDDAEIACGRQLTGDGACKSLLLRRACVGDDEDVDYARYAVEALTTKASSAFKIDGMTGSVNGHFGMRRSNGPSDWARRTATVA